MKRYSQGWLDNLINLMPNLKNNFPKNNKNNINAGAAKSLFMVWKNAVKQGDKTYRRPNTIPLSEITAMQEEGLIRSVGDKIEVTSKGEEVIKVMILGDDRSIYEDKGAEIGYNQALSNIKNVKTANKKKLKVADENSTN
jgi:hypothetical protein